MAEKSRTEVRGRLLELSKEVGQDFQLVLIRYANERLLCRLAESRHAKRFVLKGAVLLMAWEGEPARGTRDIDFTGYGDPENVLETFKEILGQTVPEDGVRFDPESARTKPIRGETEYGGTRILAEADVGGVAVTISIDVGFGDAAVPEPEMIELPGMLGLPTAKIRGYARETVIAEKFEAMVSLSLANTRVKDYYDVWLLFQSGVIDERRLGQAIAATFERRGTKIPGDVPEGLTVEYANIENREANWKRLVDELTVDPGSLSDVVEEIAPILMQAAKAAQNVQAGQG